MTSDINSRRSSTSDVTLPPKVNDESEPDNDLLSPKHLVKSPYGVDREQLEEFFRGLGTKGVHAKTQIINPDERDAAPNPDHVGAHDEARKPPNKIAKHSSDPTLNMAEVTPLDLPRACKLVQGETKIGDARRVVIEPPDVTCRNRLAIYMDIEFADQVLKLEEEYLLKQAELISKWEEAMEVALGRVTELGRSRAIEVRDKLLAFEVKKEGGLQFKQLLEEVCRVRERFQPVSPILNKLSRSSE
ncbi:hypothetical protein J3459_016072 [Metarhizium acridum]|uniref:Uncharacterized protein n=1 Tax=Metarhizium acridum (strain CQMa 102) TaxID=655827 RepID=E9E2K9_METAQ|nr:uncharacterized protein MAC_04107 [Metarhizium acridum CQMa 102]EFY89898.1 hypothetical protein MAC_04107 [Metarhizium acridum CQMa 102]KAG8407592.1 hypothetical protein J3458_020342 [Metarhizium acridum]KAG8412032.1 hypothetical protein J3459_016072 [Metarhizium acridum]